MRLDVAVLDDVLRELRRGQDLSARPIISKIRSFERGQLKALQILTSCSGNATFEQLWFVERVFRGTSEGVRPTLISRLEQFCKDGILNVTDGIIAFAGDDFDRIYSKYFARQEKMPLSFPDFLYDRFFVQRMDIGFRLELGLESLGGSAYIMDRPLTFTQDIGQLMTEFAHASPLKKLFDTYPVDLASEIYWTLFEKHGKSISLVNVTVKSKWLTVALPFVFSITEDNATRLSKLRTKLEMMAKRARSLDGDLEWQIGDNEQVPQVEALASSVVQSTNQKLKTQLASRHAHEMFEAYMETHDIDSARLHADLSRQYGPDPGQINNIGYIYMASGQYQLAWTFYDPLSNMWARKLCPA